MRFRIVLRIYTSLVLFVIVNSCDDFWKEWRNVSCLESKHRCHKSKRGSFVEIFDETIEITCASNAIDLRLMRCMDVKQARYLGIYDCKLLQFDVSRLTLDHAITDVIIKYGWNMKNFESLSFANMSSLKSVKIENIRNIELLNLTLYNVPSLTSLKITKYTYSTYSEVSNLKKNLKLHPDVFYGLHNLRNLDLSYNNIELLHPSAFRDLGKLEDLDLEGNQLIALHRDTLKGLSHLIKLNINFNKRLTDIPSGFLKEMYNLKKFFAGACSFSVIEDDLFSDAINLMILDLSDNQIQHLPSKLFQNTKNLEDLHLNGNKISTLPKGIFHELSKLSRINLNFNHLEDLPEDIFLNLKNVEDVSLAYNRIKFLSGKHFSTLPNLQSLRISSNNFTIIPGRHPFGISKHLKYLDFENVGLTEWPTIIWTEYNLTTIDISYNQFETVKLPIYAADRMWMNLSNSEIKTIYIDDWKYGNDKPVYYLKNNQITCDKKLGQFVGAVRSNLKTMLEIFPDLKDMKCYGEERKVLDYVPFYAVDNCSTNCECFQENKVVKMNCSGKNMNGVPEVLMENVTFVDLSNNNIREFSDVDCVTWKTVTRLFLSNNSLTDFPDHFLSQRVNFLKLDGNQLTELSPRLMNLIDASLEFQIYLSRNNWSCDCESFFTKDWLLRNRQKIVDFSEIFCQNLNDSSSFVQFLSDDRCTYNREEAVPPFAAWKIAVIILSLIIFILIVLVSFAYCRKRKNTSKQLKYEGDEAVHLNTRN